MWLLLNPDFTINTYIKEPKDICIDGISHPKNIFTLWNDDELNGVRLYKVNRGEAYDPILMECIKTEYKRSGKVFQEVFSLKARPDVKPKENEQLKVLKETLALYASRMDEITQAIAKLETSNAK
jgi:hypothetical protein